MHFSVVHYMVYNKLHYGSLDGYNAPTLWCILCLRRALLWYVFCLQSATEWFSRRLQCATLRCTLKYTIFLSMATICCTIVYYYENMPIQIYRKFHLQKMKIFRSKAMIFFTFLRQPRRF